MLQTGSPYSIGNGVEEMDVTCNWKSSQKEEQEAPTTSVDLYSVVKLNDLYEPGK